MDLTKTDMICALDTLKKISDLLNSAKDMYEDYIPRQICEKINDYHRETGNLPHCLAKGSQAVKELIEDWHTLVSEIEVDK